MKVTGEHYISERRSPIDVVAFCSCGWAYSTTRRQNARVRASKINAAVRKHLSCEGEKK